MMNSRQVCNRLTALEPMMCSLPLTRVHSVIGRTVRKRGMSSTSKGTLFTDEEYVPPTTHAGFLGRLLLLLAHCRNLPEFYPTQGGYRQLKPASRHRKYKAR